MLFRSGGGRKEYWLQSKDLKNDIAMSGWVLILSAIQVRLGARESYNLAIDKRKKRGESQAVIEAAGWVLRPSPLRADLVSLLSLSYSLLSFSFSLSLSYSLSLSLLFSLSLSLSLILLSLSLILSLFLSLILLSLSLILSLFLSLILALSVSLSYFTLSLSTSLCGRSDRKSTRLNSSH